MVRDQEFETKRIKKRKKIEERIERHPAVLAWRDKSKTKKPVTKSSALKLVEDAKQREGIAEAFASIQKVNNYRMQVIGLARRRIKGDKISKTELLELKKDGETLITNSRI